MTLAFSRLHSLQYDGFDLLNTANIALLPKSCDAVAISHYRPISLVHAVAKIFSKLLTNRLTPRLDDLVSAA